MINTQESPGPDLYAGYCPICGSPFCSGECANQASIKSINEEQEHA